MTQDVRIELLFMNDLRFQNLKPECYLMGSVCFEKCVVEEEDASSEIIQTWA